MDMADNSCPSVTDIILSKLSDSSAKFQCQYSKLDTYQKIENTQTQHLKRDTHMPMIIEPVKHFHAQAKMIDNN